MPRAHYKPGRDWKLAVGKVTTLLRTSWQNYTLPANLTVAPTSFALSIHSIANIWSRPGSKPISLITVIPAASMLKITEMQSCQNNHCYWPFIQEICPTKAQQIFPNSINAGLCLQLLRKKQKQMLKPEQWQLSKSHCSLSFSHFAETSRGWWFWQMRSVFLFFERERKHDTRAPQQEGEERPLNLPHCMQRWFSTCPAFSALPFVGTQHGKFSSHLNLHQFPVPWLRGNTDKAPCSEQLSVI